MCLSLKTLDNISQQAGQRDEKQCYVSTCDGITSYKTLKFLKSCIVSCSITASDTEAYNYISRQYECKKFCTV